MRGKTDGAGAFANERFRQRHRAWLRRIWWVLPLVAIFEVAVPVGIGAVAGWDLTFSLGVGVGMALTCVFWAVESPPAHIERWRTGAEGERMTEKALRPLVRDGWKVLHDVPVDGGNIDHIAIGPSGVYLLETKNLHGLGTLEAGRLVVRWKEDPDDGYMAPDFGRRARGQAVRLSEVIRSAGIRRCWVQAVIVLWMDFPEGTTLDNRVEWTQGKQLEEVLRRRETRLSADEIEAVLACLLAMKAVALERAAAPVLA